LALDKIRDPEMPDTPAYEVTPSADAKCFAESLRANRLSPLEQL
jgi:hypothetical protein